MDLQPLYRQALEYHQKGNQAEAEKAYLLILKLAPNDFTARHLLGVLRSQQGRMDEGIALLEAALKTNPDDFGALSNYGLMLQTTGRLDDALACYEKAVALRPDFVTALFNRGAILAQLKRFDAALASYDKALALHAGAPAILFARGVALAELNRHEEALASFDAALAAQPGYVAALDCRGSALKALGRLDEALASYDRALAAEHRNSGVLYNRGVTLLALTRSADALASFDKALLAKPDFAEALHNRGTALTNLQRFDEALASYDKAVALKPAYAEAWNNRGVALWNLRRLPDALASYDKAVAADAAYAQAWNNRGSLLQEMRRFAEALTSLDRVIALEPDNAAAWNNRGSALRGLGRRDEALASFDKAVALDPNHAEALANRAMVQWADAGHYDSAIADLERALTLDPDWQYARGELLHLKMHACDWAGFDEQKTLIDAGVRAGNRVVRPFVYQAVSDKPADLAACSRIFAAQYFLPAKPLPIRARAHAKIKLGYVSGEFREQATAYLMAGLYEHHDRDKFELIAIDSGRGDASPIRKRLEAAFGKFVNIAALSDQAAAQKILAEEIDILVNLNGYFGDQRLGVFAHRPAPIQVNYLGFPATLGTDYIDYIIADRIVIPEAERQFYTEQVVWLPDSYQANDSKRPIAETTPTRAQCGLPEKGFVFCNFNQSYKLTPETFYVWMRILGQVEGSVLWLWQSNEWQPENLRRAAAARGVAAERLIFAQKLPVAEHLARLKCADLFLDGLPYGAHTTASDALWAGLPLLTLRGSSFAGRVAASLLTAVGLPELICESLPDYEQRALELARDPAKLKALRGRLEKNRPTAALFDTGRFAKHIEAAYQTMWDIRRRGERASGFAVEA